MTPFALASTVFRQQALGARELDQAAAQGFTQIEAVSAPDHFDVADGADVAQLQADAASSGVSVVAVTAPPDALRHAIGAAVALSCPLVIVRTRACPTTRLPNVSGVDIGVLKKLMDDAGTSLPSGLSLAFDFPAGPGLRINDLVDFLESTDVPPPGVSLDAGHAALGGSAVDAAEELSGFLRCVRLHDNHGRDDAHRVPGSGAIDWPAVMTSCWKAGFTGPWILAPVTAEGADIDDMLRRVVGARTRLQAILEDLAQPFTFTE